MKKYNFIAVISYVDNSANQWISLSVYRKRLFLFNDYVCGKTLMVRKQGEPLSDFKKRCVDFLNNINQEALIEMTKGMAIDDHVYKQEKKSLDELLKEALKNKIKFSLKL